MQRNEWWLSAVTGVLAIGTTFAFSTVAGDFGRFLSFRGDLFSLAAAGPFPHPATTPCFWGAWAFLVVLIWSLAQLRAKSTRQQRNITWFLLAGSAFAWTNVSILFYQFYTAAPGEQVSCSGVFITNPFMTACFAGALLFLLALALSWYANRALTRS